MKGMDLRTVSELTEDGARALLESIRWPNGPACVHCGSTNVIRLQGKSTRPGVLKCRDCRKPFTVTVGTIFERSHITLRQWLIAFQMMCASKKGVSALQLQRQLGLKSYQSAWHLAHRVRWAMRQEPLAAMLRGDVEVDETYVGGKPSNMHASKRHGMSGRGTHKVPVFALVSRTTGAAHARPVADVKGDTLKAAIRELVDREARILSDDHGGYRGLEKEFKGGHETVAHLRGEYVRGSVHSNTVESYFALLKRGVTGAFHHVSKEHLHRYCDEFSFRWTTRKMTDEERFAAALLQAEGRRLQYREATEARENS